MRGPRTYNNLDRLSSVRDWLGHTTSFGYAAADEPVTQTLPNGAMGAMDYDAAGHLVGITDTTPLTTWTYAYTRDAAGEITGAHDPLDGTAHGYTYDKLGGLITNGQGRSVVTSTTGWVNDAAHEVTQRIDPSGPYTSTPGYDNAHELTSLATVSGTATTKNPTYGYNLDGDRISQRDSVSGSSSNFGYDQADRLITATSGLTTSSYSYDGDGLRQSKTVSGTQSTTTTAEARDTTEGLPTLLQDGSTRYVTGPDGLP